MVLKEEQIQQEVEARVRFKMESLLQVMENTIGHHTNSAFHFTMNDQHKEGIQAQHYREAWQHFKAAFEKEVRQPPLSDMMHEDAKKKAHRHSVDLIMAKIDEEYRGKPEWRRKQQTWVNLAVKAAHAAQNF